MRTVLVGVATVALAAGTAFAQPGKNNGNNGQGGGKGPPAASMDRGKPDRGPQGAANGNNRGRAALPAASRGNDRAPQRNAVRQEQRQVVRDIERRVSHGNSPAARGTNVRTLDRVRTGSVDVFRDRDRRRAIIDGCPPGLAKKGNGCQPPGQARKRSAYYDGWNGYTYRPSLFGLSNYGAGSYRYDNGYLLRFGNNGGIAGYIPLLGGALAIGNTWPTRYESYSIPDYYVDYFDLGPAASYRYADNVIYRVDPEDAAIRSVAALLTGDDFVVGQRLPRGYDVYNVPYTYRDRYYDTDDAWYRYSDGYVYRVDPETQLIAAAIDLLV
ncbi:hypothetical protein [Qipengyuania flava]|uniref:hypothetical protein n=1 Tax=Qipengyuania flava TaxID=192812 RepID=UPI001C62C3F2|nr:hypothetical protein [Qipengyuania flava]QYJ08030.1 hypothetical protein KUV82_04800 [Qipengyuania flava]